MSNEVGYEKDKCYFCGKRNAGYQRAEDSKPSGPFFDSCEDCARKPYPQPKQFQEGSHVEQQGREFDAIAS